MGGLRPSAAFALVLCSSVIAGRARGEAILLDFQTSWCGACRIMEPVVHELAAEGYHVRKVDGDQDPDLVRKYRIEAYPTFVALRDGQEVARVTGPASKSQLKVLIAKANSAADRTVPSANVDPGPTVRGQSPDSALAASGVGWEPAAVAPSSRAAPVLAGSERLLAASVRLQIQDSNGQSTGSGTIIDARDGEALILTCGHMFREFDESGRILVDCFGPGALQRIPATLVSYDLNSDVGLVRMICSQPFVVAKVARPGYACRPGETVISFGCDNGADATARITQVVSIDRYRHAPNLQVAFEPVQGRSGGGLFNSAGELVGVCNAADAEDKQGLFAALKAVYAELDRAKLSFVYQADGSQAVSAELDSQLAEAAPIPVAPVASMHMLSDDERTLLETLRSPQGAEVICLVRALDDPQAKSRVFQINRASSAFWRELAGHSGNISGRTLTSLDHRMPETRAISKKALAAEHATALTDVSRSTEERSRRIWPFQPIGR